VPLINKGKAESGKVLESSRGRKKAINKKHLEEQGKERVSERSRGTMGRSRVRQGD